MIDTIKIENFKSIINLTLELGRVNVIIGANGCGKTNILEAITFASAASQSKLENEFLGARLRNTKPEFMFSAFEDIDNDQQITVSKEEKEREDVRLEIINLNGTWTNKRQSKGYTPQELIDELAKIEAGSTDIDINKLRVIELFYQISEGVTPSPSLLKDFLIYSPEETKLRTFSDDTLILPLGRRGEGLFQHLKEIVAKKESQIIEAINEGLQMLDWFDGFRMPENLLSNEYTLSIGDRFLNDSLHYFDQRSTNEGFLYLLFYLTLFNSNQTPAFFAVDNIEASFNPRLCTKLIQQLTDVAKTNDKQVIFTTHSPYILDGLDLSDDEQRLFVARRDIDGHTRIERIPQRESRDMLLSDLWMSGLIGGLPDNF